MFFPTVVGIAYNKRPVAIKKEQLIYNKKNELVSFNIENRGAIPVVVKKKHRSATVISKRKIAATV